MTKSKHTPGPWFIDLRASQPELNTFRVKDENRLGVAIVCGDASDAALIAAAPELLGTLQDLVEFCIQRIPEEVTTELGDLCNKADDAIAKATGKS